jgi:predicted membrane-bound spermidine synthase
MSVEIMASRLLAPYYGDTVYLWGSLIAVIMTALAIGYRQGGQKADIYSNNIELSNIILVAGVFIIMIPLSTPYVLELVQWIQVPTIYEPLLPSAILLTVPSIYLGMVSPYALRLSAKNLTNIGGVSGGLSSLNTVGGIVGTFLTVFLLIPNFGTREIITSLGVILVSVSMIGREWEYFALIVLLMIILVVPSNFFIGKLVVLGSGTHVYSVDTPYSSLNVVDDWGKKTRTLYLDDFSHSKMYLNDSVKPVFKYTDFFNLAFGYSSNITSVLFIGGGGFSGPKQFLADYPWVRVDVVEIDSVVVDVAYKFFNVPSNQPRLKVFIDDGRSYLKESSKYDLIILDAYSKSYVPFHLMTQEFFSIVAEHLNDEGVLVSNIIGSTLGDTSRLLWSQVFTAKMSLPSVSLYRTQDVPESVVQNIILIAGKRNLSLEEVTQNIESSGVSRRHINFLDSLYTREVPEDGLILRDNYAPVEDLLNPVTLTEYNTEGRLDLQNILNPVIIAGFWALSLGSLYALSKRFG